MVRQDITLKEMDKKMEELEGKLYHVLSYPQYKQCFSVADYQTAWGRAMRKLQSGSPVQNET